MESTCTGANELRITHVEEFLADERAQDIVEYALVGVLIGLGAVVALKAATNGVVTVFSSVGTSLTSGV